jgi:basic membrane protein A and related proteins
MKKSSIITLALGLLIGSASAQQAMQVGMAFDAGGKNDKSFNQSAFEGAQKAAAEFKVSVKDFEPSDPSQVGQGIQAFAQNGFDLVVGVGFNNEPPITKTAKAFPQQSFAVVDSVSDAPNVSSLIFREQEGSYLVGYLAAQNSATGVIGFIGGMDIPLIHKFEAGYTAGAKAFNSKIKVIAQYVGTTPAAWNDPAKAKEIAGSMKAKGTDIVYAAAGGSGGGLIDYIKNVQCIKAGDLPKDVKFTTLNRFASVAKSSSYTAKCAGNTRPMFFIGVDSNQNYLGDFDKDPKTMNHGLTSMLKRVDVAVYETIKDVSQNKFKPGIRAFGLSNSGVGYALDEYNTVLITKAQQAQIAKITKDIISGKIVVPEK